MQLVADRELVVGSTDPGDSHCSFFGGGWGGGGGGAAIVVLPLIAILGTAAIICAADHSSKAGAYERLVEDTKQIAELEARVRAR